MQRLAIHLQHYKQSQVGILGAEAQRKIKNTLDNRIDFTQSKFNFQAIDGSKMNGKSYTQTLKKICTSNRIIQRKEGRRLMYVYENGKKVRKDANVMTGIVVTLDRETVKEWGIEKSKAYFKECALYLRDKFGNCIDDVVHTDESGAGWHLHFYASPIIKGSFNSKKMWDRMALINLHDELTELLQSKGFEIVRGEENSGIDYKSSYKDYKREMASTIHSLEKIDKALESVKAAAVHREASAGVFGIGSSDAKVELTPKQFGILLRLAEQGKSATLELSENRKRIEQSHKLQQAEEEKALLWSDADGLAQENEKLKKELSEASSKAVKEYQDSHKKELIMGTTLNYALEHDKDFAVQFSTLYKEYMKRMKAQRMKSKKPTNENIRVRVRKEKNKDIER